MRICCKYRRAYYFHVLNLADDGLWSSEDKSINLSRLRAAFSRDTLYQVLRHIHFFCIFLKRYLKYFVQLRNRSLKDRSLAFLKDLEKSPSASIVLKSAIYQERTVFIL